MAGSTLAESGDKRLDIYWIDVEGGGATLIVTPVGESVLIDSGNPGPHDADRIVQVATKAAGLTRIDHLVTTHYHIDHFGGAATLATVLPIGHVHDNGTFEGLREPPDETYKSFKAERRSVLSPGETIGLRKQTDSEAPALSLQVPCRAAEIHRGRYDSRCGKHALRRQQAKTSRQLRQRQQHCAATDVRQFSVSRRR